MAFKDWNESASLNSSVGGVNIAEGSARADTNDAIRAMMAELRTRFKQNGFNPLDYGATGDGSADDVAILNSTAALAKAAAGALILPAGYTFGISSNVFIDDGVRAIFGGGKIKVLASAATTTSLILRGKEAGQPTNVTDCDIIGITFDCNGKASNGIYAQTPVRVRILDNKIVNCTAAGTAILCRGFINGAESMRDLIISRNQIQCATTDDPPMDAIQVDAQVDFSPSSSADTYWKANFAAKAPTYRGVNIKISDNRIEGGYYGIAANGLQNSEISNNTTTFNTRGITSQNCTINTAITGNTIIDCRSSAIHLAYGSSFNKINDNFCQTTRSSGQALFQAYVGCEDDDFNGNRSIVTSGTGPLYHCYTGVHSSRTMFRNGYHRGIAVKAYIAIESAWDSTSFAGNAVSLPGATDTGLNSYANANMSDNVVDGNVINGSSAVAAIALIQITDGAGNYALQRPIVTNNRVIGDSVTQQIKLVEEGSGFLSDAILSDNSFAPAAAASKYVFPRGRGHFAICSGNVTVNDNPTPINFTAADTSPSVSVGSYFKLTSGAATNVTDFDDTAEGQIITVMGSGNDTLVHNGAIMALKGAANTTPTATQMVTLISRSGVWIEMNRSY